MMDKVQRKILQLERKIEEMARKNSREEKTIEDMFLKNAKQLKERIENADRTDLFEETSVER